MHMLKGKDIMQETLFDVIKKDLKKDNKNLYDIRYIKTKSGRFSREQFFKAAKQIIMIPNLVKIDSGLEIHGNDWYLESGDDGVLSSYKTIKVEPLAGNISYK